jgi:uncharacterized membrane protein
MEDLPVSETISENEKPSAEDRLFAGLSYPFWFVCFPIFLISEKRQANPFLRFHAYQAVVLGLMFWLGGIAMWNVAAILGRFILFGLLLYPMLKLAEWLAFLTVVFSSAGAWLGYCPRIPGVTAFAESMSKAKLKDANQ